MPFFCYFFRKEFTNEKIVLFYFSFFYFLSIFAAFLLFLRVFFAFSFFNFFFFVMPKFLSRFPF